MIAAAFADEGEKTALEVQHSDGSQDTYHLEPEWDEFIGMRVFGIIKPSTLTVAQPAQDQDIAKLREVGFEPGDTIVAVNDQPITQTADLLEYLFPEGLTQVPKSVSITVKRSGSITQPTIDIGLLLSPAGRDEQHSGQVLGMIPRIRISQVEPDSPAQKAGILADDIILRVGTINNPTITEMQNYCHEHNNQAVALLIGREQNGELVEKLLHPVPQRPPAKWWQFLFGKISQPLIGVGLVFDTNNPVVAHCRKTNSMSEPLALPRGAVITAVDAAPVQSWNDVIAQLTDKKNQAVQIFYRTGNGQGEQSLSVTMPDSDSWLGFAYAADLMPLGDLPLKPLEREFKGKNWAQNLKMGSDMTYSFIAQSYLMLRGMIKGTVSPKAASGPVGILKISYTVAHEKPVSFYLYFLAMISVCIAVFNFLPLPILDGGHMVFLLIEKIKGSPRPHPHRRRNATGDLPGHRQMGIRPTLTPLHINSK